jgi:hypothetical protein
MPMVEDIIHNATTVSYVVKRRTPPHGTTINVPAMTALAMKAVGEWAEDCKAAIASLQAYFDPAPKTEKVKEAAGIAGYWLLLLHKWSLFTRSARE